MRDVVSGIKNLATACPWIVILVLGRTSDGAVPEKLDAYVEHSRWERVRAIAALTASEKIETPRKIEARLNLLTRENAELLSVDTPWFAALRERKPVVGDIGTIVERKPTVIGAFDDDSAIIGVPYGFDVIRQRHSLARGNPSDARSPAGYARLHAADRAYTERVVKYEPAILTSEAAARSQDGALVEVAGPYWFSGTRRYEGVDGALLTALVVEPLSLSETDLQRFTRRWEFAERRDKSGRSLGATAIVEVQGKIVTFMSAKGRVSKQQLSRLSGDDREAVAMWQRRVEGKSGP